MSVKVILFDLDGTLLPMEQNVFVKTYFGLLAQSLAQYGYEPKKLIEAVWAGTNAMVKNDGSKTNEEVFWDTFVEFFGEQSRKDISKFEDFYKEHFDKVQVSCGFNPEAKNAVEQIKKMGFRTVLATNPIFPAIATKKRIKWAGLKPEDFEFYTTYENSKSCKPNLDYYRSIVDYLGVKPQECLMVGNDMSEDMVAKELGIKVFLLTDCIINREGKDISGYPNGDFSKLMLFVKSLKK